jgi:hypothetical protein
MNPWDIVLGANPITAPVYWGTKAIGAIGDKVNEGTDNFVEDKSEHAGEGFGRGAVRGAHEELRSILGDYAKQGVELLKGDEGSLRRHVWDAIAHLGDD